MTATTYTPDIPTGARASCAWCGQTIDEVQDPYTFVTDWHIDGDYGCDESPDTGADGTGSHLPMPTIGFGRYRSTR